MAACIVVERGRLLLLRDTDDDGVADQQEVLLRLETEDDYPHNALGGIDQAQDGSLILGLGENHGLPFRLIGADGKVIAATGGLDGFFRCSADGKNIEHFARGVWNPFSLCVLADGRIFAVDNDPDASPPCRLLHVVRGRRLRLSLPIRPRRHAPAASLERRTARHAADGLRHGRSADGDRRPCRQPVGHQLGRPPHRALSTCRRAAHRTARRAKWSCKATPTSARPAWPSRRTARSTSAIGCCATIRCTARAASGD